MVYGRVKNDLKIHLLLNASMSNRPEAGQTYEQVPIDGHEAKSTKERRQSIVANTKQTAGRYQKENGHCDQGWNMNRKEKLATKSNSRFLLQLEPLNQTKPSTAREGDEAVSRK
jgi:hypothetical protein